MKKLIGILLIVMLTFSGCSYASQLAGQEYYTNVDDYGEIWELSGFRYGPSSGISPFFPQSIEDLKVLNFFCRYDVQLPLGEGVQLLLEIQYDDDLFATEVERISSMSFNCDDSFKDCGLTAYANLFGEKTDDGVKDTSQSSSSFEYALIDEEKQIIRYIFLQFMPKEQVEFDHAFLPSEYS